MGKLLRWGIVLVLLAGGGVVVWQKTRPQPVEVSVKQVIRGTVEKTVANTRAGTVNACRRAKLSPSMGGQIARLPIHEGDTVKAGSLLLEIWNEDMKAQLSLARKEAEVARANATAACVLADEAKVQEVRAKNLYSKKVNSTEQVDRAVSNALHLQALCEAAQGTVQTSQARIRIAEANLSRTRLVAPFDGVIAQIEGELNEYVTPSPIGVPTPPTVDLIENSCYYISAPIDEVDAAAIRVGMEARITLDAFKNREFGGVVRRISPFVLDLEKQARTVEIEASFTNPEDIRDLLAGYSADIEIILQRRDDTIHIPTESLVEGHKVYLYSAESGTISESEVTIGLANWATTEILSGAAEGQLVVTNVDKPGLADGVKAMTIEGEQ